MMVAMTIRKSFVEAIIMTESSFSAQNPVVIIFLSALHVAPWLGGLCAISP